jgi:stage II sporulation protein P
VLREDYGYNVINDTTYYDVVKGYNMSYSSAEAGITKDLEENPSIEVLIDLHRNSGAEKLVMINGIETAQIMLFNGLCRNQSGPMLDWENPYLQDNLAFSLQLQIKSFGLYPGLFKKNYLKSYRYNMHFRPKSLLIEWGSVKNTVESARNAVAPFAQVLDAVLKGNDNLAEEVIKD